MTEWIIMTYAFTAALVYVRHERRSPSNNWRNFAANILAGVAWPVTMALEVVIVVILALRIALDFVFAKFRKSR